MPTRLLLTLSLVAASWTMPALAAGDTTGKVVELATWKSPNQIMIRMDGAIGGTPPACATNAATYIGAFNLTFTNGEGIYANLLTAVANGSTVQIQGAGTCTVNATVEDIGTVRIRP